MKRSETEANAELIALALALGADEALVTSTEVIKIEDHFPQFCEPPQCNGYGQSANCPPHGPQPDELRQRLKSHARVLVFRIDVPMEIMLAEERHDVSGLLQQTAAALERKAAELGYDRPWGIAADCCKRIFCREHDGCSVLAGGKCRNPDKARPSMSGMGVNFNRLSGALGWDGTETARMVGLVLLD